MTKARDIADSDLEDLVVQNDIEVSGGIFLGGTGSANKLDDYEEGTFTCEITIDGSTGQDVGESGFARYVKVGSLVMINVRKRQGSHSSTTGVVSITGGLPFVPEEGLAIVASTRALDMTGDDFLKVNHDDTTIYTRTFNDSNDANHTDNAVSTSDSRTIKVLEFSASYFTLS